MKLYTYDHCPFCVRTRLMFGIAGVDYQHEILLNDDEENPIRMIGAKQVPILQKDDGSFMGESLDIVDYIQTTYQVELSQNVRTEIQDWLSAVHQYCNYLITPRIAQLDAPEFVTENARNYFKNKKTQHMGDLAEHINRTSEYLALLQKDLEKLDSLLINNQYANGRSWSKEDILLFPLLRSLTVVKGVVFSEKVANYINNLAKKSQVDTYYQQAI